MQAVTMRVEGDFTDAYLYMRWLFLLVDQRGLVVLNWPELISELAEQYTDEQVALRWAFHENNALYQRALHPYLQSPTIRNAFHTLVGKLARQTYHVNPNIWRRHVWHECELCAEEMTDFHLFMRRIYFSCRSGTFAAELKPKRRRARITEPTRIHDMEGIGFSTYWRTFCMCGGSEGLLVRQEPPPTQDITEAGDWCHFDQVSSLRAYANYWDVANVDLHHGLSYIRTVPDDAADLFNGAVRPPFQSRRSWRRWDDTEDHELLHFELLDPTQFWDIIADDPFEYSDVAGGREKLVFRQNGTFRVYRRWADKDMYEPLDSVDARLPFTVLDVAVADFGLILDAEDAVYLLDDDGLWPITDRPSARIRTFPNSRNYQNIFLSLQEDHVLIGCPLDDMFRDQKAKVIGLYGSQRGRYE